MTPDPGESLGPGAHLPRYTFHNFMDGDVQVPLRTSGFTRRCALIAAGFASPYVAGECWPVASASSDIQQKPRKVGLDEPLADESTTLAIQTCLDARSDALMRGDRQAFVATIDQRNPTWRRIQGDVFDLSSRGGWGPTATYSPVQLQDKPLGYVKAFLEVSPSRGVAPAERTTWVFSRQADGTVLHAEPTNDELGMRQTTSIGTVVLSHYNWDADIVDRVAAVAQTAWTRVSSIIELPKMIRPIVSLNPTYAAHSGLRGFSTWAAYLPGSRDTVLLRSLESFGAGPVQITETEDSRLLIPLTHELTHLATDCVLSIVKIPHWMSEGLAEYVADNFRTREFSSAVASNRQWSLDKASEIIEWGSDISRGYTANDISLAYAHASHGTRYFVERFGITRFWELAREFASSRRWAESFLTVTNVSWSDFGADWFRWSKGVFA